MAKSTGKRGHRSKAENVLSRKATQHHDFVGQAENERAQSRGVEQERIRRDQDELSKEVGHEMAAELEQMAGVSEKPAAAAASEPAKEEPRPLFERPRNLREAVQLVRDRAPEAFEAMRAKAEERLEQMPAPVKEIVQLSERAIALALRPVRAGVHLLGRVLLTPLALVRLLVTNRGTA